MQVMRLVREGAMEVGLGTVEGAVVRLDAVRGRVEMEEGEREQVGATETENQPEVAEQGEARM